MGGRVRYDGGHASRGVGEGSGTATASGNGHGRAAAHGSGVVRPLKQGSGEPTGGSPTAQCLSLNLIKPIKPIRTKFKRFQIKFKSIQALTNPKRTFPDSKNFQ
jgi:hypothetical protein